jgi:hypothetical protein
LETDPCEGIGRSKDEIMRSPRELLVDLLGDTTAGQKLALVIEDRRAVRNQTLKDAAEVAERHGQKQVAQWIRDMQ